MLCFKSVWTVSNAGCLILVPNSQTSGCHKVDKHALRFYYSQISFFVIRAGSDWQIRPEGVSKSSKNPVSVTPLCPTFWEIDVSAGIVCYSHSGGEEEGRNAQLFGRFNLAVIIPRSWLKLDWNLIRNQLIVKQSSGVNISGDRA